ncbi:glycogen debranching N-terminal domain-containing protein [Streptomyces coeruleorubidus]|uniref:glycogen debranching N-terminal domain-containing protein n=1 Tax=Streptomyces coeruleorubidus TaxID=116188 RepID=UPI0036609CF9
MARPQGTVLPHRRRRRHRLRAGRRWLPRRGSRGVPGRSSRLGESTPDPAVAVHRRRSTTAGLFEECLEVTNAGTRQVRVRLTVTVGTDLVTMDQVTSGRAPKEVPAQAADGDAIGLAWVCDGFTARLVSEPAPDVLAVPTGRLMYDVELDPSASWSVALSCTAAYADGDRFPPPPTDQMPWSIPVLRSADRSLDRWLKQSLADLDRLRLTDPQSQKDRPEQFLAAGAPWFLTLFGRDALWAARMLLSRHRPRGRYAARPRPPAGCRHRSVHGGAAGQDPARGPSRQPQARRPAVTALGVLRHGRRRPLVDHSSPRCLALGTRSGRGRTAPAPRRVRPRLGARPGSGDGFLKYIDQTGRGLSSQGWKDSDGSIRYRDGSRAHAPIALCEVRAHVHEAALCGAALLRAFGRPGADVWEAWAGRLAARFRDRFWVSDERGLYPAVALDGDGKPVDSATSGFGHLLGTGLLNAEESALLVARIAGPDLDAGHGLRTLSSDAVGYNPYGYHVGSIWAHDTAMAVDGLVKAGFPDAAASLAAGLLTASTNLRRAPPGALRRSRQPGEPGSCPCPASCRPQAWAAAFAVFVPQAALGLDADVPGGTVTTAPTFAAAYAPLTVTRLQVGGGRLDVTVTANGTVNMTAPAGLAVAAL